ncbi:MAG: 16S rRNA (adenine(1518)-N(6)/adenine(1519)-N(6)) -dimethyltransferase RsmA [Calditrichia bacterium]
MRLKKSLGQHFIHDKNILRKFLSHINLKDFDCIVEIGPGNGNLTELLLETQIPVFSIELDPDLIPGLQARFQDQGHFTLIHEDFLKMDLGKILSAHSKNLIVGNIPYYITSPIIFKLIDHWQLVHEALLLMQLEVAERIASPPGNRAYGVLSVATQMIYRPVIVQKVSPSVFVPPPKVWSALLKLSLKKEIPEILSDWDQFMAFLHLIFSQKRKTIKNNLRPILSKISGKDVVVLEKFLSMRAEMLDLSDFIAIFNVVKKVIQS